MTEKAISFHIFNNVLLTGPFHQFCIECPRNRVQLGNTGYFMHFQYFPSLWPLRSILWSHGLVQSGRLYSYWWNFLDRSVTPFNRLYRPQGQENRIFEIDTVPCTTHVKSVNRPFKSLYRMKNLFLYFELQSSLTNYQQ